MVGQAGWSRVPSKLSSQLWCCQVCLQVFLLVTSHCIISILIFLIFPYCNNTVTLLFQYCRPIVTIPIPHWYIPLLYVNSKWLTIVSVSTFHYAVSFTFQQFYHIAAIHFPLIVTMLTYCYPVVAILVPYCLSRLRMVSSYDILFFQSNPKNFSVFFSWAFLMNVFFNEVNVYSLSQVELGRIKDCLTRLFFDPHNKVDNSTVYIVVCLKSRNLAAVLRVHTNRQP